MSNIQINRDLIRSFGRVNGRKLRPRQLQLIEELLPKFAINVDTNMPVFPRQENLPGCSSPLCMEIGFGYGEHIVGMALRYPHINFIGCEPFINGVATLLKHIDDNKVENISILYGDARLLIDKLPEACIDKLFILFPDPWPKAKHHKKRIISAANLKSIARIMKNSGKLLIATDHVDYAQWIRQILALSAEFIPNASIAPGAAPEDWIETRYQQKAKLEGREAVFFNYLRN